jgi:hypothetical protein
MDDTPQSKGGQARADKLSETEKREIASKGAQARHDKAKMLSETGELPKAKVVEQPSKLCAQVRLACSRQRWCKA